MSNLSKFKVVAEFPCLENMKESYVILEFPCKTKEEAEKVFEERQNLYRNCQIVEIEV